MQNPFDEASTRVAVQVEPHQGGGVRVVVVDDVPGGISDHRLVTTVWKSSKTDSPTKRGRMGRGMKELISVSDWTEVASEAWSLVFARAENGEWTRTAGSGTGRPGTRIEAIIRLWSPDVLPEIVSFLTRIRPPQHIAFTVNDVVVEHREAAETYAVRLPTVMFEHVHGERIARDRIRDTQIDLFAEPESWVYEMGLPIEPIDYPLSVDIAQRVPLREQRDTLTGSYRQRLFATLLNLRCDKMSAEDLKAKHAIDAAAASSLLTPAAKSALATAWTEGRPFASTPALMSSATGQHIKVCNLRLLPEPLREVVKDAGQNVKDVLEQRRLACISMIPDDRLTERAKRLARVWTAIASAVGRPCRICFAEGQSGSDASFDHVARRLTIYSDVVKPVLFDDPVSAYALGLLAHELAHWKQHGDEHGGSFHSDGEEVGGAIAAYLFAHHDQVRRLLAAHVASDRAVSLSTAAAARHARSMAKRP